MKLSARCLLLILALLLPGCQPFEFQAPRSPAVQSPGATAALAAPDGEFDRLFTRFGGGWTGADGTYSVGLPDGRTAWVFGDTFLGRVHPDRSRSAETPLINNCIVIQEKGSLSTRHGGTPDTPAALVAPAEGAGWYWPADGTVEPGVMRVFYRRFEHTGPDPWQWRWVGTELAAFSLPDITRTSLSPVTYANGVMYGSSIVEAPDYTYIFGTEDLSDRKYAHLARAPAGRLTAPWEFYSGSGWSGEPRRSVRILEGVANQYSVVPAGSCYLLVTMDNRTLFSNLLMAYRAFQPQGPWEGPVPVYSAPQAKGDVVAYNAFAHPQFTFDNRLLVSYNLNSVSDFSIPYSNADSYRPRFIRIDVGRLMARFEERAMGALEAEAATGTGN